VLVVLLFVVEMEDKDWYIVFAIVIMSFDVLTDVFFDGTHEDK